MKKTFDIQTVANELKGGSAFFPEYNKSVSTEQPSKQPDNSPEARKPQQETI